MSRMGDALFSCIERIHGNRQWGRFLDAGTGLHSLKWIQALKVTSWTAITADQNMKNTILKDDGVCKAMRDHDQLVVGNWMDDTFTGSLGQFDTILADYLIGAVDGFSPYEQDVIINKLRSHLLPNGRMYFVGMSPIPDEPNPPANIISEIRRARDSCILLAGHRPYREFPLSWMTRHLRLSGMRVVDTRNFTILHSEESAVRQIRVARSKLDFMEHSMLRQGMDHYLVDLEARTRAAIKASGGKIPLSYDYVIAAVRSDDTDTTEEVHASETEPSSSA